MSTASNISSQITCPDSPNRYIRASADRALGVRLVVPDPHLTSAWQFLASHPSGGAVVMSWECHGANSLALTRTAIVRRSDGF
jgi:hypothetical protein